MLIEYERRINQLRDEISAEEIRCSSAPVINYMRGQLDECERLLGFYLKQMVQTGRVLPEKPKGGDDE